MDGAADKHTTVAIRIWIFMMLSFPPRTTGRLEKAWRSSAPVHLFLLIRLASATT